ncbi:hypothetical protein NG99_00690 [Erwinia typographi]|uniref:Iron ABC transporter n=1 Tax=Erwinia typographi TaxID=371042 RepID=A0A0A3ZB01_9GAMM|nr:Fe(3+)-hydroxamate ABC transporter permease FhuB [Erwinia typographi]KGT96055.1 hypothetical protein NG99_00690 [Erwinia typographi]
MTSSHSSPDVRHPLLLIGGLMLLGLLLTLALWMKTLPLSQLPAAIFTPDSHVMGQLLFHYATLPRLFVALLAGAGFSLAGLLFQQTLRNPMADPTTFGVSAGAQLMLTLATVWAPWLLRAGQETVALIGGLLAVIPIILSAFRPSSTPQKLTLSGLMLTLYAGCVANVIALFGGNDLQDVFIWGSGSLNQNSWQVVFFLLPRVAIALLLSLLMLRVMNTFSVNETSAKSLGVSVNRVRTISLLLGSALCASVVSVTGVIGFVGMAAPTLTRLAGARRFSQQLLWTPIMGAALLLFTDQLSQWSAYYGAEVSTGTLTALMGAPLLLWLIPRLKKHTLPLLATTVNAGTARRRSACLFIPASLLLLILFILSVIYGRLPTRWAFTDGQTLLSLLPLRAPRSLAALAAGGMLGAAGVLIQRLTANPMSSPELLGISSGATLGVMLAMLLLSSTSTGVLMVGAVAGSALALIGMLLTARKSAFSAEKILLAGIALSTIISAMTSLMMTSITPQVQVLQDWLAGSTYRILPTQAVTLAVIAMVLIAASFLTHRWLLMLSLSDEVSRATGINIYLARSVIILLIALLTAAATLLIGPLSFVGLMAPHMARMSGLHRPALQLGGAVLIGAAILLLADWAGRNILYPQQLPAGLLATFIGGPYYLLLMRKQ